MENKEMEDKIAKAKELIEKDKQEKARKCSEEIKQVLNKYGCTLVTNMFIKTFEKE